VVSTSFGAVVNSTLGCCATPGGIHAEAEADRQGWWERQARELEWFSPWEQVLDESNPPFYKWFVGGMLNVSHNCLDRHVAAGSGDRVACHRRGEEGEGRDITYAQLLADVERCVETYFRRFGPPTYVVGDAARRDRDGYRWVIGRIDDVVNVSGHRLASAEVESAIVADEMVAEAALIGQHDEQTGQPICAFVTLQGGVDGGGEVQPRLGLAVVERGGGARRPCRGGAARGDRRHRHQGRVPQVRDRGARRDR